MLVTHDELEKIVDGCILMAIYTTDEYERYDFWNIKPYVGRYGVGYRAVHGGQASIYIYQTNIVSQDVYDGHYDIKDACMTANNVRTVRYHTHLGDEVNITPIWEVRIDTITGKSSYKQVEDYKGIVHAGRLIIATFRGPMDEKVLKAKIRRKLRDMIRNGQTYLAGGNCYEN